METHRGRGNWSESAALTLAFSPEAQGALPERLFLKMVNADTGDGQYFGDPEARFYTRDNFDLEGAPLLRCYHAAYSDEQKRYHSLLDDVSGTHVAAAEKKPTLEHGLALAEGLAITHARWWGRQKLAAAGAAMHSIEHVRNFVILWRSPSRELIIFLGHIRGN